MFNQKALQYYASNFKFHVTNNGLLFLVVPASNHFSTLPLECKLVNKSALKHIAGVVDPPTCHFAVKKRTKSDALRTDLMKKCKFMYIFCCYLSSFSAMTTLWKIMTVLTLYCEKLDLIEFEIYVALCSQSIFFAFIRESFC